MTGLPDREAIINQLNTGLEAANNAVATGPYHPDDDQLIREFIGCSERWPHDWLFAQNVPRSQIEAIMRRLQSTF